MNEEVNQEDREKIVACIEKGKVEFAHTVNIDKKNPDFTITNVELESIWEDVDDCYQGGFTISWQTVSAGFGELVVSKIGDKIKCQNEALGKRFIKSVFDKLIEKMELDS